MNEHECGTTEHWDRERPARRRAKCEISFNSNDGVTNAAGETPAVPGITARMENRSSHVAGSFRVYLVLFLLAFFASSLSPGDSSSAAAKKALRVMTYNIHVGVGMD